MVEKVVVSNREVADVAVRESSRTLEPNLPSPIPLWAKFAFPVLVLLLPVLCIVVIVLRTALSNQNPRTKLAWTSYLSTLLIVSGLLTSVALVVVSTRLPAPLLGTSALSELDERSEFPQLPSASVLEGPAVSQQLKPLTMIVSPVIKTWFGQNSNSGVLGAGAILEATQHGYLIATAHHVVGDSERALLATSDGIWAVADVIARNKDLDLALLYLERHSGSSHFLQPIAAPLDGSRVFVIGHPQGLLYSLSTGIISRESGNLVQFSAPISPGNSGGPVYDEHGSLIAIVSSTTDKGRNPNAENLNFAVAAEALKKPEGWTFRSEGEKLRDRFELLKWPAAH